jgi:Rrf2 family transcriptional regulator, cysteine metabolism repressor
MNISAKAEYACLAVIDLTILRYKNQPVQTAELAKRNAIPERFLVQILLQLKGAGIVQSVRGASGGYRLSAEPESISLLDIIRLIDGPGALGGTESSAPRTAGRQVLHAIWHEVTAHEEALLRDVKFADLAESAEKHLEAHMYYI